MRVFLIASSLLVLAACSKPDDEGSTAAADAAAPTASLDAKAEAAAVPERPAISIPQLAYRYGYALEAPAKQIRDLVGKHEAACQLAGPAVCQLTGAQVTEQGDDRIRGELSLRATPQWLATFRAGLDAQLKAAGGRVVAATVNSDDLSRQIVDSEAALRARTTLRDRLERTLATRPGKLPEFLELEQELARVQGEIDATRSELAVMRGRVATSELKLTYESSGVLAPQGVLSPLRAAASDVAGIMVAVMAGLMRLFAFLLPVGVISAAVFWLVRGRRPKRTPAA
ncbi:MAG: DUF4349 domain-containing protein [Phenylobacterium sp.]